MELEMGVDLRFDSLPRLGSKKLLVETTFIIGNLLRVESSNLTTHRDFTHKIIFFLKAL